MKTDFTPDEMEILVRIHDKLNAIAVGLSVREAFSETQNAISQVKTLLREGVRATDPVIANEMKDYC